MEQKLGAELFDKEKRLGMGFLRLPLLNSGEPNDVDLPEVCRMVDAFFAAGYRYFDNAYFYLGNKSECYFKEAVTDRYPRAQFQLATKLPCTRLKEGESPYRIFNHQLEKCGVTYFDVYLLHGIDEEEYVLAHNRRYFDFLQELKDTGKARCIGFSFHDSAAVLDRILTEHPEVDVVQIQLNYLDWDNPIIQSGACYEVCRKHGKGIIIMEPVKGGTLVNIPEQAKALMDAQDPGQTPASWALRFAASHPGVVMVLSGMSSMEQIRENTALFDNLAPLKEEETRMLQACARIIRSDVAIPCTGCAYCAPGCPVQIPIPQYFSLYNEHKRDGWQVDARGRYKEMTKVHPKASACIGCGQCEEKCPQHLPVMTHIQTVASGLE